ncbi:MAG: NAD-dependent epimerase/dehydratase family protein [Alphaproteobacteria bacterium]|nr:NAD-dependent epimerase/dehydratase family protein [Alphaproteobacteria bacterium]
MTTEQTPNQPAPPQQTVPQQTLVTGATGFIGAAVTRALLAAGHRVRILTRPDNDRRNLAGLDIEIAEGNLLDHDSLTRALAGCDALFHIAADYRIWVPNPAAMYQANVEGTQALMNAALLMGVKRIVYTSSVAVLGSNADGTSADETTPSHVGGMIGHYKRSKFLAEETVKAMIAEKGLPAVIVNPSAPIGPRDIKPTPTGRMIVEAMHGRMPAFVDTGLNVVHVDDVAIGHVLAYDRGEVGERYILGGENLLLRDILRHVAEITGRKPPTLALPRGLIYPIAFGAELAARITGRDPFVTIDGLNMARKKMFFSIKKAESRLGYRARAAYDAILDAVNWFKQNNY